jgi:hypothetical protein
MNTKMWSSHTKAKKGTFVEDLEAALEQFREIAVDLRAEVRTEKYR